MSRTVLIGLAVVATFGLVFFLWRRSASAATMPSSATGGGPAPEVIPISIDPELSGRADFILTNLIKPKPTLPGVHVDPAAAGAASYIKNTLLQPKPVQFVSATPPAQKPPILQQPPPLVTAAKPNSTLFTSTRGAL